MNETKKNNKTYPCLSTVTDLVDKFNKDFVESLNK